MEDEEIVVPFFNPRKHNWYEHFEIKDGLILPGTSAGAATIKILDFNKLERVLERLELIDAGVYP